MGKGNHLVKLMYNKLTAIIKQLPTLSHRVLRLNSQRQRIKVSALQIHHQDPLNLMNSFTLKCSVYGQEKLKTRP